VTSCGSVEEAWGDLQRGAAASFHLALLTRAAADAAHAAALEGIQFSLPVLSAPHPPALSLLNRLAELMFIPLILKENQAGIEFSKSRYSNRPSKPSTLLIGLWQGLLRGRVNGKSNP
jgi:hypothetical protein